MNIFNIPEAVHRQIQNGCAAVVGGAIRSKIEGTSPHDIDVYFFDKEKYTSVVAQTGAKIKYRDKDITIFIIPGLCPIELIYEYEKKSIEDCIGLADFNIASGCFYCGEFILPNEYTESVRQREMVFLKALYPHITLQRLWKYLQYGYTIEKTNLARLYRACGIILH